ncbi:MAG: hypothetical protein HYX53_06855 [Chloroflexi bacterium]|nr:hypothetical protein [Chloroflexota bacterium]
MRGRLVAHADNGAFFRERSGLAESLHELSLKSAALAICIPLLFGAGWAVSGHSFVRHDGADHTTPMPLLSALLASFVVVPMLALVAAAAAGPAVAGIVRGPGTRQRRALQALFVVAVAAWGLVTAYAHVTFLVPLMT